MMNSVNGQFLINRRHAYIVTFLEGILTGIILSRAGFIPEFVTGVLETICY